MYRYRKILVPFDSSSQAMSAVEHAVKLAMVSGAAVTLFHVMQEMPAGSKERAGNQRESIAGDYKAGGLSILEKLKENYAEHDVKIDIAVTVGSPAKEIIKKAKIENYDVIIMGSRGLGKIPGLLMGSVSNKVCRGASCPVIVIHAN